MHEIFYRRTFPGVFEAQFFVNVTAAPLGVGVSHYLKRCSRFNSGIALFNESVEQTSHTANNPHPGERSIADPFVGVKNQYISIFLVFFRHILEH